ncbi:ASCH domain-containing protein [Bacillus sp. SCS-151]|uniref:ASCH domain-containing protein n=1 Tax=Nanhaiella sioensis TaxID=3115293 RepID=UPI00397DA29F
MLHRMGLYKVYLQAIKDGNKTVEVRLNDQKRRNIKIGDTIEFVSVPEADESLRVNVTGLKNYHTFKDMYEDIPLKDFDCEGWTMKDLLEGTYGIYTLEQEERWGVLAISIKAMK